MLLCVTTLLIWLVVQRRSPTPVAASQQPPPSSSDSVQSPVLSSRSAWTEDSTSSTTAVARAGDSNNKMGVPLSPLSAALRTLQLNQARVDGDVALTRGLTPAQRRLIHDLTVHEDLAAIVKTATKLPVDENAPGVLCKLSRKTSASRFEDDLDCVSGSRKLTTSAGGAPARPRIALFEAKPLVGRSEVS